MRFESSGNKRSTFRLYIQIQRITKLNQKIYYARTIKNELSRLRMRRR